VEVINTIINLFVEFWWVPVPLVLFPLVWHFWLQLRRLQFKEKIEWTLLEIKIPKEVEKSPKAMEQVISGFHGIFKKGNKWRRYFHGGLTPWLSLEIVGIAGQPHFFIRAPLNVLNLVESQIYAQYPKAEIYEVEDYSKVLGNNFKAEGWKAFGVELTLAEKDVYPIRTYRDFGLEEESEEERKIDPLSGLTETAGDLEGTEQLWIQYLISPVFGLEKDAKEEIEKIAGRQKPPPPSIFSQILAELGELIIAPFSGAASPAEAKKQESGGKSLHEAEKKTIELISEYGSKPAFKVTVRWIYLAKEQDFKGGRISSVFGAFAQFARHGINSLKPDFTTGDPGYLLAQWRQERWMKKLLFHYKQRALREDAYRMSSEVLATLFHFPGQEVSVPTLERVPARKVQPPANLPTVG
jgi:hypothetical protein